MRLRQKLIVGIKCMLDCLYWYNKENDPNFEFDLSQDWKTMTDEDIMIRWVELINLLEDSPAVLVVRGRCYNDFIESDGGNNASELFNRHNGIITRRYLDRSKLLYLSAPEDKGANYIFAVIPSEETRKSWVHDREFHVIKLEWLYYDVELTTNFKSDTDYNCMFKGSYHIPTCAYLTTPYIQEDIQDGMDEIPDAYIGNSFVDSVSTTSG